MSVYMKPLRVLSLFLALSACRGAGSADVPGDSSDARPFSDIAATDVIHLTGAEPFWGGTVKGDTLVWTTPEDQEGTAVPVERFAGRGGLSFSGELDGQTLDIAVTPGECSDGMSDRVFPFTVTLTHGPLALDGCAWSDAHPFTGPETP